VTFGEVGGGPGGVCIQPCRGQKVARLLVEVRRGGGVAGQARVHRGQGREAGHGAIGVGCAGASLLVCFHDSGADCDEERRARADAGHEIDHAGRDRKRAE